MAPSDQIPPDYNESTNKQQQRNFYNKFKRKLTKPRFAVEVLGIVVLIIYAAATLYQSCKMREATEATKDSADAAIASVRAWLVLTHTDTEVEQINNIPPDPVIPVGIIHFRNAGKTPATDILGYTEFRAIRYGNSPDFPNCPSRVARRDAVINADSDSEIWATPDTLTKNDRESIDSGDAALYVHGCITYHDVLNPNETRTTEFKGFVTGAWGNRNGHGVIVQGAHWETFTVKTN